MYPTEFEYLRPKSVAEALEMLEANEGSRVIAGGQSLMPMMKLRIYHPVCLVDIGYIPELRNVSISKEGEVRIGAMVTHYEVIENNTIRENLPILSNAAERIGDVQIRNRGTLGGSICEADPSADYFPALLTLEARVVLRKKDKTREMSVEDLILGPFETAIEEDEILVEVIIPRNTDNFRVEKYARRMADFATAYVAGIMKTGGTGNVEYARIAVGALQDHPQRLRELEDALRGKKPDHSELVNLVEKTTEPLSLANDIHGSEEYRKAVLKRMLLRVVTELLTGKERL